MGSNQTQEFFLMHKNANIITARKRVCEGYAFTRVCQSTGGEYLGRCTPWAGTPPGQVHPLGAVHAERYGQQAGGTHPT